MCHPLPYYLSILLGLLAAVNVQADDVATPVHLVGHEDLELLDRVQDLIDDWDTRKLENPVFETVEANGAREVESRKVLKRSDLAEFIADVEAAEVLGKAFFWDMQVGSDFRRLADGKTHVGTACATCHYRNGTDARSRHTARIPYIAWNKFYLDKANHPLEFGELERPFDVMASSTLEVTSAMFDRPNPDPPMPYGYLSLIVGSAGVEPRLYDGNNQLPAIDPGGAWEFEKSKKRRVENYQSYNDGYRPQWSMFIDGQTDNGKRYRQITPRNSPSVMNSGFADRLFHDGRAESTFNGFSIFGDRDQRPVLYRGVTRKDATGAVLRDADGSPKYGMPVQVHVAITKAALASQAVGPILSDVEMSYTGRTFPNVACRMLDSKILAYQQIEETDSVLGRWKKQGLIGSADGSLTYRELIKRAFRREWWEAGIDDSGKPYQIPLVLLAENEISSRTTKDDIPTGEIMAANFPLYWGLSIMIYESSLVSNHSPFDGMMVGNSTLVEERWQDAQLSLGTIRLDRATVNEPPLPVGVPRPAHMNGASVFQHGFRVFLNRGCVECHGGPLFSELYERFPEPERFPINERLKTTLLPNSRSEAIAIQRSQYHREMLDRVVTILSSPPMSLPSAVATRLSKNLDQLREPARGNEEQLEAHIAAKLVDLGGSSSASAIAALLLEFERNAVTRYGNRTFLTEDERIDLAQLLMEPVLVESMPIPPRQVKHRPRIPIQGPLATEDYAFYDLAFYAIGNSPPRYDTGNGEWEAARMMDAAISHVEDELQAEILPAASKTQLQNELNQIRVSKGGDEVIYQLSPELGQRMKKAVDKLMLQRPHPGTPGSSNRFKYSPELEQLNLEATVENRGRRCDSGPEGDPDAFEKSLPMPTDWTWDRNRLPENQRRSNVVFRSRARTLVSDEEPWGFRKPLLHDNELAFWGAFKTPSLRNVELTAPYMHNGRFKDLAEVIEFYDRGGDLEPNLTNYPDKHPKIVELDLTESDKKALQFFLLCLTDERVRRERGPFDHPSLKVINGYDNQGNERLVEVPEVGRTGWSNPNEIPSPFPDRQ